MMPRWLDRAALAAHLSVRIDALPRLARQGKLPASPPDRVKNPALFAVIHCLLSIAPLSSPHRNRRMAPVFKALADFLACRSPRTIAALDRETFRAMAWGELHHWRARHEGELLGDPVVYADLHAVARARLALIGAEIERRLSRRVPA